MLKHAGRVADPGPYSILADLQLRAKALTHEKIRMHDERRKIRAAAVDWEKATGGGLRNAVERCDLGQIVRDRYELCRESFDFEALERANSDWLTFEEEPLRVSRRLVRKYLSS